MYSKHLILGGAGFIGRHVAQLLAASGHDVTLADRSPPSFDFPIGTSARIRWTRFEFASADWEALIADADVIHLYAWTSIPATANANPLGDLTINVGATLGLLEAMRRWPSKRLVFASSGGTVYGRLQHAPVMEDHPFDPITAYGAGKATAEIYLRLYGALHGLDCRIARISNPFGAGQDLSRGQGAATTFLYKALTDQPIVIWGDGEVVRDYVHISDVAKALVLLSQVALPPGVTTFNIASGVGISLNTIVAEIRHHLGKTIQVVREPARSFDLPISVLDIARASRHLGWQPQLSFSEGMQRSIVDLDRGVALSTLD